MNLSFVLRLVWIVGFSNARKKRPNIVVILADDLGWNDVSFHGSNDIFTPNIDALAYNAVVVQNHYSETLCTPSRSALLTGKYPIHTGTNHGVLHETHPAGLPLSEKILPEYLKPLGYKTHAVGKWHLGFYKKEYTPPFRGFDSFYGFWSGYQDYYKHNVQAWFVPYDGYDMRRNMDVDWSARGKYSTDLFSDEAVNIIRNHNNSEPLFLYLAHGAPHAGTYEDPLQAPDKEILKFGYIHDPHRRIYAAMVSKLDESVGKVIEALNAHSMLDDTILLFLSDNGAPTTGLMRNYGSNWPLKGEKSTPWEGGIRTTALIWSKLLTGGVRNQAMHITDWLPTLYSAAGGNLKELAQIDGTNKWEILAGKKDEIKNHTMLHNIDEEAGFGYAALRYGPFKLVNGSSMLGYLDDWYGAPQTDDVPAYDVQTIGRGTTYKLLSSTRELDVERIRKLRQSAIIKCAVTNTTLQNPCHPFEHPCLFNIEEDPCEKNNLYGNDDVIQVQKEMEKKLQEFRISKVNAKRTYSSIYSNPALYNNTWTNWGDFQSNVDDINESSDVLEL